MLQQPVIDQIEPTVFTLHQAQVVKHPRHALVAAPIGVQDVARRHAQRQAPGVDDLERVHDLLSSRAKNAKWMNSRLVSSFLSQFFHSRLFLSSQAKLRSTTQRLGITENL